MIDFNNEFFSFLKIFLTVCLVVFGLLGGIFLCIKFPIVILPIFILIICLFISLFIYSEKNLEEDRGRYRE
jgi:hypothetical protein